MIITSMGLEKENKTLETLLTLPVKRESIILGKMAGAIVVALLMAVVYIGGFNYYMSSFTPPVEGGTNLMQTLGLVMTSFIISFGYFLVFDNSGSLSICMILECLAKMLKAPRYAFPIILLVMIPIFNISKFRNNANGIKNIFISHSFLTPLLPPKY